MMKKIYIFFLTISNVINAQDYQPIDDNYKSTGYSLSPPEVSSLERSNFSDINLYTGKADISIPLIEIKEGNITYPITLSYNSGGIKVQETASNVGLGWSINNTVISRNVQAYNDFNSFGNRSEDLDSLGLLSIHHREHMASIFGYNYVGYFKHIKNRNYKIGTVGFGSPYSAYNVDRFPDIYNMISPIYKSSFFFKDENTAIELNGKGTKIKGITDYFTKSLTHNSTIKPDSPFKDFKNIEIISNNGIVFSFKDFSISQLLSYSEKAAYSPSYMPMNENILPEISAWYVSEIKDPSTNKKIIFSYDDYINDPYYTSGSNQSKYIIANTSYSYTFSGNNSFSTTQGEYECMTGNVYRGTWYKNLSFNRNIESKRINRIEFSSGYIVFRYIQPREDSYNERALTNIELYDKKDNLVKQIKFNYDYFTSECSIDNNYNCKRLKLKDIIINNKSKYSFNYEESVKLPPKNSGSVDFLGYYNNSLSHDEKGIYNGTKPSAKLYYYPAQYEYSLLPFNINSDYSKYVIPGDFDRNSNEYYAKAFSLKEIIFPTGGKEEFTYESNSFKIFGQEIKGGGIRIKKQILKDVNNSILDQYIYNYKSNDGTTSGILNNIPSYGFPTVKLFNVSYLPPQGDPNYELQNDGKFISHYQGITDWDSKKKYLLFNITDKNNVNEDIVNGGYIGYNFVTKEKIGNGHINFEFTSNKEYPNEIKFSALSLGLSNTFNSCIGHFLFMNSGMSKNVFTDYSFKRGHIKQESHYEYGNITPSKVITNEYIHNNENLIFYGYTSSSLLGGDPPGVEVFFPLKKRYMTSPFLKNKTTVRENYKKNFVENVKKITHDNLGNILKISSLDSNNDESIDLYLYPRDWQDKSFAAILHNQNRISTPLSHITLKNKKISTATHMEYGLFNNILHKKEMYTKKGDGIISMDEDIVFSEKEIKIRYDSYDNRGNLTQYTLENGIPVSIIWGYGGQYPILKAEGVSLSTIPQSLIDYIVNPSNTGDNVELAKRLNYQRNEPYFKDALVTGYIYKPLVGVTNIIQPNGQEERYQYDDSGRLEEIRNGQGELLKSFKYNYAQP